MVSVSGPEDRGQHTTLKQEQEQQPLLPFPSLSLPPLTSPTLHISFHVLYGAIVTDRCHASLSSRVCAIARS